MQSQGSLPLLLAYSALLSNPVCIPAFVESTLEIISHQQMLSTRGSIATIQLPQSCFFVSHPSSFLPSPGLFLQAFRAAHDVEVSFQRQSSGSHIYPSAENQLTPRALLLPLISRGGRIQQHGPQGRGKLFCSSSLG